MLQTELDAPSSSYFPLACLIAVIGTQLLLSVSGLAWITCAQVLSGGSVNCPQEDIFRGLSTSTALFVQELCKEKIVRVYAI